MSEDSATLRRKIASATDLQLVVRAMKTLAASSIGQYEKSVLALADYYRTVELGLGACFRANAQGHLEGSASPAVGAVVFGSDQGLVGQFNEVVASFAKQAIAALPGTVQVWAVGERMRARLTEAGVPAAQVFAVPTSVKTISPLIAQILVASAPVNELHLFYNRPKAGMGVAHGPFAQRLLPLDEVWRRDLTACAWPTKIMPQVMAGETLAALIREYLFISLFRACAESLAAENASRLAAMQRADKNIDDLLEELNGTFHRARQDGIDEELFDVVAGYEALTAGGPR